MVLHVRHMLKCSGGNLDLRRDSVELCLKEGLLGMHHAKSHKCLSSIRNLKTYEYVRMNNIQLV